MKKLKVEMSYDGVVHTDREWGQSGKTFDFEATDLEVSDGYHTIDELYEHRIELYIALCKQISRQPYSDANYGVWRAKIHSDGSSFDGWFVLGIGKEAGKQITYHLPDAKWAECDFAETLNNAPEFDGHKPGDVLQRLKNL